MCVCDHEWGERRDGEAGIPSVDNGSPACICRCSQQKCKGCMEQESQSVSGGYTKQEQDRSHKTTQDSQTRDLEHQYWLATGGAPTRIVVESGSWMRPRGGGRGA